MSVKALLIIATLSDPIGYSDMATCEAIADRLNETEGKRIAYCVPNGATKHDQVLDSMMRFIERIDKFQKDNSLRDVPEINDIEAPPLKPGVKPEDIRG